MTLRFNDYDCRSDSRFSYGTQKVVLSRPERIVCCWIKMDISRDAVQVVKRASKVAAGVKHRDQEGYL